MSKTGYSLALDNMAQLVGHHPTHQKVAGLIPGQGTCHGCGFGPWSGHMEEAASKSFPLNSVILFLAPCPSL